MNGKVMLLIDADNVSADVISQAVEKVLTERGAIHVRRACCTAESAQKNLALFKRHSIRPIVNLSAGRTPPTSRWPSTRASIWCWPSARNWW